MTSPEPSLPQPSRRIALVKPPSGAEDRITHALQLFESILWAFKGTTRSTWETVPPEAAEVIVVHQGDPDERIAAWRRAGKRIIEIATGEGANPSLSPVLVYPFKSAQALALLERLDGELSGVSSQQSGGPGPDRQLAKLPSDPWSFVDTLRTIREVQNSESWLVARDVKLPRLWLRADGAMYVADHTTILGIRDGTLNLATLNLQKSKPPTDGVAARAGTELSWFAGYHASREIAPWLNAAARFRVTRWPNFGLIRPAPQHIRVAAAMASTAGKPSEIAARARVSVEEAIRTLNALAVAGVVVAADEGVQAPATRAATTAAPRGGFTAFLRNMRKHLGMGT
jgi:hypothetical protein